MKDWVLKQVSHDLSKDIKGFLEQLNQILQMPGNGYCFGFPVGDPYGWHKSAKRFVELLLVYHYNFSHEIRIVYWAGEEGTKEKVMSYDEFENGLYKMEKLVSETNNEFTIPVVVDLKERKPRRMFRMEIKGGEVNV